MRIFFVSPVVVFPVVIVMTFGSLLLFAKPVYAQKVSRKFKNDSSSVSIGPLKAIHRDTKFDPETNDNISYPGIFGKSHYFFVGRRDAGFGGSLGNLEIRIPSFTGHGVKTFQRMLSRKKGTLRILNHLYTADASEPSPPQIPIDGVFVGVDYRKTSSNGKRVTAELMRDSEGERYAKGKIIYKLLAKKKFKRTGPFGQNLETTRYQYELKLNGKVKDLIIRTTPADSNDTESKVLSNAKLKGKFTITFENTITIL